VIIVKIMVSDHGDDDDGVDDDGDDDDNSWLKVGIVNNKG